MNNPRIIPIVMDSGALSDAAARSHETAHDHSHAATDASAPIPARPPVFLKVGDREIDEAEIAREMQHHRADNPHTSRVDAARALVVRELLLQEIERLGIAANAEPHDSETLEEASIRLLIEQEVPTPEPDETACRHYYENNRERLHTPDQYHVHHILLAASPDDVKGRYDARELGERLIAELKEFPERFDEYAMRHSSCPSRDEGGDLGWIVRGQTTPEFDRQLFMLREGLVAMTIESRWGHHVVRVDEISRGEPMTYDECAEKIASYLELQGKQNALHQYLQILSSRYPVIGLAELEALAA